MNKKYLVTGTAGFIGHFTALRLLERGDEVIGIDNINDYYDVNLKYGRLNEAGINRRDIRDNQTLQSSTWPGYRFIKMDICNTEAMNPLFSEENFDGVCHLAAQAGVRYSLENPYAYTESNITGFLNILEACRHKPVEHLVYASSSSIYGMSSEMPFSTSQRVDHPVSLYAATKKANELMAHTYSHLYNIPTTGLRFFTVYGPWGRPDMAPFLFTKAILNDRPIKVFNHGNMQRDFTYIDDIVEGIVRVLDKAPENGLPDTQAPYRVYNIGNSQPIKLMDFISAIEQAAGKEAQKEFLPMQPGDVPATWADTSDLERDFGYRPSTEIRMGVQQFVDWYRQFYTPGEKQ